MDMTSAHGHVPERMSMSTTHVPEHMSMSTTHVHSTGDMAILLTFKGSQQYPIIFLGHCYDSSPTAHILRHTFFDNDTHSFQIWLRRHNRQKRQPHGKLLLTNQHPPRTVRQRQAMRRVRQRNSQLITSRIMVHQDPTAPRPMAH